MSTTEQTAAWAIALGVERGWPMGLRFIAQRVGTIVNPSHDYQLWAKAETLAREIGVTPGHARKLLGQLVTEGVLEVIEVGGGKGRATLYRWCYWPQTQTAPTDAVTDTAHTDRHTAPCGSDTAHTGHRTSYRADNHTEGQPMAPVVADAPLARGNGRKRDLLFEAVCDACGMDWDAVTKSARGALNRAVKELRDVGATPAAVHNRAGRYRLHFADAALTPTALAKHWALCANPPKPRMSDAEAWLASEMGGGT